VPHTLWVGGIPSSDQADIIWFVLHLFASLAVLVLVYDSYSS